MAFLLFAFQKLCLKRQINSKTYQEMMLCSEERRITSEISIMQQTKATMQDAWSLTSNAMSQAATMGFQASVFASSNESSKAMTEYQAKYKNYDDASKILDDAKDADKASTSETTQRTLNTAQLNATTARTAMETAYKNIDTAKASSAEAAQKAYVGQQAAQQALVTTNQLMNSVFQAGDNLKLSMLQSQGQRIDQEKAQTESDLMLLRADYDSVKKAETEEAKNSAPSFGLA